MLEVTRFEEHVHNKYITYITDTELKIVYKIVTIVTVGKRGKILFDSTIEPKVSIKTLLKIDRAEIEKMVKVAAKQRKNIIKKAEDYIYENIFISIFN